MQFHSSIGQFLANSQRRDSFKDFISRGDLLNFDAVKAFWVKIDIDSAYFGDHFLQTVVMFFSQKARFKMDHVQFRIASASSSRFALSLKNNGPQKIKIRVNGCYPEKINLGLFPNMKVLEVHVDGITEKFMINMYFVGTKFTHKTTYFCNYQVKAVTALLNIARENAIQYTSTAGTQSDHEQMCNLHQFESRTNGTQDSMMKNKQSFLTLDNVTIFAQCFDRLLVDSTQWTVDEFIIKVSEFTGCHKTQQNPDTEELEKMFNFLKELSTGVFFCASCAGFKDSFHQNPVMSKELRFDDSVQEELEKLKDLAVKSFLISMRGDPPDPLLETGATDLHFDLGLTFSPLMHSDYSFFLKGREAQKILRDWLKMDVDAEGDIDPMPFDEENPFLLSSSQVQLSQQDVDLLSMGNTLQASKRDIFEFGADEEDNDSNDIYNQDDNDDDDDDDDEDADILYDPENAPTSVVSLFDQWDTNGHIGGVQSSKVALRAELPDDVDTGIEISSFSAPKLLRGGTLYNPKHKFNGLHDCRKTAQLNKLRQLPFLLSCLFLWREDKNKSVAFDALIKKFHEEMRTLIGLQQMKIRTMHKSGAYSVRVELYYSIKDLEDKIQLPPIDLKALIWVGDHSMIRTHTKNEINAVGFALSEFNRYLDDNVGRHSPDLLNKLEGSEMTTLVFCLEKAVQQLGLFTYGKGKITRVLEHILEDHRNRTGGVAEISNRVAERRNGVAAMESRGNEDQSDENGNNTRVNVIQNDDRSLNPPKDDDERSISSSEEDDSFNSAPAHAGGFNEAVQASNERDIFFGIGTKSVKFVDATKTYTFALKNANLVGPPTEGEMEEWRNKHPVAFGRNKNEVAGLNMDEPPDHSLSGSSYDDSVEEVVENPIYCMVRTVLYSFKKVDLGNKITEMDLRITPAHCQQGAGYARNLLSNCPNCLDHAEARVEQIFWNALFGDDNEYAIPVFKGKDYRFNHFKAFNKEKIEDLYSKLADVLWQTYDISIWVLWCQRKRFRENKDSTYSTRTDMTLENFPTTRNTFNDWLVGQDDDRNDDEDADTPSLLFEANVSQKFKSDTCNVTNPEQMCHLAFQSTKNKNNRWNKLVSVQVYQLTTRRIQSIHTYLLKNKIMNTQYTHYWKTSHFNKVLFETMFLYRRKSGDTSKCILWDTCNPERTVKWERFRPVLVSKHILANSGENNSRLRKYGAKSIPKNNNEEGDVMFTFANRREKDVAGYGRPIRNDVFFKEYKPDGFPQLDNIIVSRILLFFGDNPANATACEEQLVFKNIVSFGWAFGGLKESLNNKLKNLMKKKDEFSRKPNETKKLLRDAVTYNRMHWHVNQDGGVALFDYKESDERMMNSFLESDDFQRAKWFAHQGLITENFLLHLMAVRKKHDRDLPKVDEGGEDNTIVSELQNKKKRKKT